MYIYRKRSFPAEITASSALGVLNFVIYGMQRIM